MDSPRTPKATSLSAELKELIDQRNMLTTRTRMKVLSALDEIQKESIEKREQSLRAQTIQEILSSEVSYLRQLEVIMEYFMRPIQEQKLLSTASYTTLFESIETLYNVNGELLKELKLNPENVANAFCKLAPFFKLYSVYAYNYKRALVVLQDIQQSDPAASEFIALQETRPEVGNKLSALLIAPIQRVPRYKLLLQEVLRHTSPKQMDYNALQASLVEIEKVASHINSLVAEYEDTQKLLELQKHLAGPINLIKPGRKLIRQGPLMRVSRRGNSSFRRHFVLLSDTLLYCKGDPECSLTVCCLLPLNKCKVERVLSNKLFKVICMHETLLLYSESNDGEEWIEALQDAVGKYIECRKTLRKDSSSRMPMRKIIRLDDDNVIERRCPRRKRPLSANDASAEANNSNIIYVNRDTETDASTAEGSTFFLALKRFKRASVEFEPSVNEKIKSWIDATKRKSTIIETPDENNFFHQTRNFLSPSKSTSALNNSRLMKNDTFASTSSVRKEKMFLSSDNSSGSHRMLSFKTVGKFFSTIGNTFKDFFSRE